LLLAESIEEVRLVFAPISSTKKTQTPVRLITKQSDIMAGCEGGCSQFASLFLEQGEFDAWIADYARVRGFTPAVRLQKRFYYLLAEGTAKVHHVEGDI
jgi:predicted alternative tryptophan synthase beta-subunit